MQSKMFDNMEIRLKNTKHYIRRARAKLAKWLSSIKLCRDVERIIVDYCFWTVKMFDNITASNLHRRLPYGNYFDIYFEPFNARHYCIIISKEMVESREVSKICTMWSIIKDCDSGFVDKDFYNKLIEEAQSKV